MKRLDLVQNSPEWIAYRKNCIGASDSAALLGLSKFSTPYQLFLEKKGLIPGFQGNAATQAGHNAEDKARAVYEMFHGDFETFPPMCVVHSEHEFMMASLDGYNDNLKRILEIKYPSEGSHQTALEGKVPEQYWVQMQHQLAVCDEATHGHYFSFREFDGAKVEVKRDEFFINEILLPGVLAFKTLLENNTPPPLMDIDHIYVNEEKILECFRELFKVDPKKKSERNSLSDQIVKLAGRDKVKTPIGQLSSVKRNGVHSYYKITEAKQ